MEVRSGYKQAEVEGIPEEWQVKRLGELAAVTAGGTPSRTNPRYWNGDIPWVTTSEIDFCTINEATQCITKDGLKNSAARLLPAGTLLMALYGQGKTRGKVGVLGIKASTNQACAAISLHDNISREFIFHFLASKYETIRNLSNTGNQENLNGSIVRSISVLLPPEPEQRAIAGALGDADALLGALTRLIAKKRDLKQAAMQQLLTGQTRLPGFSGEWEVKRLGDESDLITKGTTPTSLGRSFTRQGINFVKVESLTEDGHVIPDKVATIDEETHRLLKRSQLKENDILFSIAGALGRTAIVKCALLPANTNQALAIVRLKQESRVNHGFLLKYLTSPPITRHVEAINVQAAQANLSLEDVRSFKIQVPSPDEQTAIATVLSDMDAELAALEARLAKTRALKQGMMQELLTGRTRLV